VPGDLGLLVDAHFEAVYTQPEPPANDCECRNPDGTDDANCLKQWQDDNFDLDDWEVCVEVDGAAVAAQEDMHDYLVWGGPSGYTLDPTEPKSIPPATIGPNPCGYDRFSQYPVVPEGIPRQMVFRGWLVMLKPLPSGAHKLRYYVIPSAPDQELGYEPMGVTMDLVVP
jgi:hypothetical protein